MANTQLGYKDTEKRKKKTNNTLKKNYSLPEVFDSWTLSNN